MIENFKEIINKEIDKIRKDSPNDNSKIVEGTTVALLPEKEGGKAMFILLTIFQDGKVTDAIIIEAKVVYDFLLKNIDAINGTTEYKHGDMSIV